jgi:tetratricopeptide (TPR) repeat protein
MMGLKKPQLFALLGAVVVAVLLAFAPRIPQGSREAAKVDPQRIKTAEAVALVNGQEPMRGIMMLREILEEDPNNAEAHWHLGLFSVQSGQYDKALERFKKVLELDAKGFPDAWFYQGRTYATLDSIDQAIASLTTYRTLVEDTAIAHGVDRFLLELKNEKP